jgi:alpha-galactosidase
MTQEEKEIILNKDAIKINQDPSGQGTRIKVEGDTEIWSKKLKDGNVAVLLLNLNKSETRNITLNPGDIGISKKVKIKDVYANKDLGSFSRSKSFQVKPHAGLFLIINL